eukprot:4284575-Pleurochrysis_carterae.AAC.1
MRLGIPGRETTEAKLDDLGAQGCELTRSGQGVVKTLLESSLTYFGRFGNVIVNEIPSLAPRCSDLLCIRSGLN